MDSISADIISKELDVGVVKGAFFGLEVELVFAEPLEDLRNMMPIFGLVPGIIPGHGWSDVTLLDGFGDVLLHGLLFRDGERESFFLWDLVHPERGRWHGRLEALWGRIRH